jgi:hypothetical protein
MRQQVYIQQHFRRGNASVNQDELLIVARAGGRPAELCFLDRRLPPIAVDVQFEDCRMMNEAIYGGEMPDRDVLDHATAQRANGLTVYWVLLSETGLPPRCSNRTRLARYLTTLATSTAGAV